MGGKKKKTYFQKLRMKLFIEILHFVRVINGQMDHCFFQATLFKNQRVCFSYTTAHPFLCVTYSALLGEHAFCVAVDP